MEREKSKFSYYNEFFKVYLSELSSCEMILPPAFVALSNINQEAIPKNARLKDHEEKIWNVKLEMKGRDLIIKDGWKDFVLYHSLVDGDFLVFKYGGCSHFEVELYGINGLKKGKTKENDKVDGNIHVLEEPKTEEWHIGSRPIVVAGGCKGMNTETEPISRRSGASCRGSGSKPSETCVRNLPRELRVAKAPSFAASKRPSFVWKMTETKRNVYVPKLLVKAHGIKMQKEMKLLDENDKLWPVGALFWDSGQIILSSGWMLFCREKKLKVGDECVFEFVLEKDNVSNVMQVKIVRHGPDARGQKHGKTLEDGGGEKKTSQQRHEDEFNMRQLVVNRDGVSAPERPHLRSTMRTKVG